MGFNEQRREFQQLFHRHLLRQQGELEMFFIVSGQLAGERFLKTFGSLVEADDYAATMFEAGTDPADWVKLIDLTRNEIS